MPPACCRAPRVAAARARCTGASRGLNRSPTELLSASDAILYRYFLAPCAAKPAVLANLQFVFGSRDELQRTDASYFRHSLVVDLLAAGATAAIELH